MIDHKGTAKKVGKKTRKDKKKGKATLISLLGYKNTINYSLLLKNNIFKKVGIFKNKANDLKETLDFVVSRDK